MGKGRKKKTELPTCKFSKCLYYSELAASCFSVVELSDDRKNVRCKICEARHGKNGGWIQKESLAYHLKSDAHAYCLRAHQNREHIQATMEQSMREESAVEERMEFILASAMKPAVIMKAELSRPSVEEQEMWDNYAFSSEIYDAGIDYTKAAAEEKKRLEKEATDFDIWHGADFLPEKDLTDGELLLDELEQEDILTELLKNARMYTTFIPIVLCK